MISKPLEVKALENFQIWLRFKDGLEGKIDLSHLKGKGVFQFWDECENFKKVYIDEETQAIAWDKDLELDTNKLYLKLKGKTFEQWKKEQLEYAADK